MQNVGFLSVQRNRKYGNKSKWWFGRKNQKKVSPCKTPCRSFWRNEGQPICSGWWRYFHPSSHLWRYCCGQPVKSALALRPVCTLLPSHAHQHTTAFFPTDHNRCASLWLWWCVFSWKEEKGGLTLGAPLPANHLWAELFKPDTHMCAHRVNASYSPFLAGSQSPSGKALHERQDRSWTVAL